MKRNAHFAQAIVLLIVATTATSASAGWRDFWHNLHVDYARNNAWPDPFNEVDASMVSAPFDIMKANGWRMHNTIGHELFRQGDGALLAAGHKRIHWIATQAPTARRAVYVLRGSSQAETQARIASVQKTIRGVNVVGPAPAVLVTDIEPATSSGAWATKINREWLEHLTAPQLPSQSVTGNTGVATPTSE
ncbi:MAG: hypothetical protein AB8B91_13550 [Rubripirellula sp.]